jgi:hypothetical protein
MANDERLARSNVACRMRIDRVLIHCKMGIGRSPTLAAAYLVWTGTSIDEAIRKVEGKVVLRPRGEPIHIKQIRGLAGKE